MSIGLIMIRLLFILCFFPLLLFSQINEDEFYNISGFNLSIHKINKGEYLFYGDNGNMIRTYDSGKTYSQNYSGTKNQIMQLANNNDKVVGFTNKYEFMASYDKGSHWIVSKLSDSIVSIDASDELIVLASYFENLLISSDVGKTWKKLKINDKYFKSAFIIGTIIYAIDMTNSIIYTEDIGETWKHIEAPIDNFENFVIARRNGNKISLKGYSSLYELNDDLTFTSIEFDTKYIYKYITTDYGYAYALANSNTREINYYNYNRENKTEELVSSYSNLYFYGNTFRVLDLEVDDNVVFMTFENRTILRSSDYGKTWEVITSTPIFNGGPLQVFDSNNWSILASNLIYKSVDGGVTFKPGNDNFLDTINSAVLTSNLHDYHYFNKDSAIFFTKHIYANTKIDEIYTTNDGGITLKGLGLNTFDNIDFVADLKDYLLLSRWKYGSGSLGRNWVYYKLDSDLNLDSINVIDSVYSNFIQSVVVGNKIYIFYAKITEDKNKSIATIAVSSDTLKTIKDIFSIKNDSLNNITGKLVSRNGNIYFNNNSSIPLENYTYNSSFRLDTKTDEIHIVNKPFAIFSNYGINTFVEDQKYFKTVELIYKDTSYKFKYVEVSVEGTELKYDTIGSNSRGFTPMKYLNSEDVILIGGLQNIWKKIEPDRLTSVEIWGSKTENLPIYPFAPSPNPAKDKLRVKFYTESMEKIDKLRVFLVNITTGKKVEIKHYEISITNNWNGELAFDVSDFPIGSYLVNLSLDDYNRSSKLIITK